MSNEWEVTEEGVTEFNEVSQKKQSPRLNIVIPPSKLKEDQVPTQITNEVIQSDQYHRKYFSWRLFIFICKAARQNITCNLKWDVGDEVKDHINVLIVLV